MALQAQSIVMDMIVNLVQKVLVGRIIIWVVLCVISTHSNTAQDQTHVPNVLTTVAQVLGPTLLKQVPRASLTANAMPDTVVPAGRLVQNVALVHTNLPRGPVIAWIVRRTPTRNYLQVRPLLRVCATLGMKVLQVYHHSHRSARSARLASTNPILEDNHVNFVRTTAILSAQAARQVRIARATPGTRGR